MLEHVTSFSDAAGTNVVNDVLRVYNSFEKCISEYQEHSGAVNTSTSVAVGYQYADGSANTIRQTGLVYPNGRVITPDYGTTGGIDEALSRVASLIDLDGTHLVDYTLIGADTFVQASSPQPQIAWSLINGTGSDPYTGLDQFNQIADNRWYSTATNANLDRIQHDYDRAGNRLYRKNTVAEAASVYLDELYSQDGLYRLARLDRGQLNSANTAIVSGTEDFTQAWAVDATGNWLTFDQSDFGGAWTLTQARTANMINEITSITGGGWVQPAYDGAGNMTKFPVASDPSSATDATYDTWSRTIALSTGGTLLQTNCFDGLDRRITEQVMGTTRGHYFSSEWQDLEDRVGSSTMPDRQFLWGLRSIDNLVLRDRGSERLYALADPNWNVTAIISTADVIAERYGYSAYGSPAFYDSSFSAIPSTAYEWEILFAGYRYGGSASAYTARYRELLYLLGVWQERDRLFPSAAQLSGGARFPLQSQGGLLITLPSAVARSSGTDDVSQTSPYEYVSSRPTQLTDPTGLQPMIPVPLPCSPAETAQCEQDCLNDITITTGKGL